MIGRETSGVHSGLNVTAIRDLAVLGPGRGLGLVHRALRPIWGYRERPSWHAVSLGCMLCSRASTVHSTGVVP
jgi:hypothetical protein